MNETIKETITLLLKQNIEIKKALSNNIYYSGKVDALKEVISILEKIN